MTMTVIVKVDWFVERIIVHLVFLVRHTIVVISHQVCLYTLRNNYIVANLGHPRVRPEIPTLFWVLKSTLQMFTHKVLINYHFPISFIHKIMFKSY